MDHACLRPRYWCDDLVIAEQSFEKYVLNWMKPSGWERLKLFKFLHRKLFQIRFEEKLVRARLSQKQEERDHLRPL